MWKIWILKAVGSKYSLKTFNLAHSNLPIVMAEEVPQQGISKSRINDWYLFACSLALTYKSITFYSIRT